MKKAVINTGGRQYLVTEGEELEIGVLRDEKEVSFEPLLVIDETKVTIGSPTVSASKVTAQIIEPELKGEKVVAIRYKAKKRVHKRRGHRQLLTRIKISKIS